MTDTATRFRSVADGFTRTVEAVPPDKWDNAAPCADWVARDVVRHLVEWVPGFFSSFAGVEFPAGPSADEDPAGVWAALRDHLQALLDDETATSCVIESPTGPSTIGDAIGTFVLGDVLVHTWDIARAVGLDETLDADEVHGLYETMLPMDAALRASGHFGPQVDVADDASEQTKLLAFTGRRP